MERVGAAPSAFTFAVQHVDGHADILLIGELDSFSVKELRSQLEDLIAHGHRDLRLNLSALRFCDASGLGALIRLREQLLRHGGALTIHHVRGIPLRMLALCGLSQTFERSVEPSSVLAASSESGRVLLNSRERR